MEKPASQRIADRANDAALVARLRSGDQSAFEALHAAHAPKMRNLAMRLLKNPEDADEAVQDAMLRCARRIDAFRQDCAISSWLYRVTFNVACDQLRRRRRRVRRVLLESLDERTGMTMEVDAPDPALLPDEEYFSGQYASALREAMAALTPGERDAARLVLVRGLKGEEASRCLGIKHNTLKTHVRRGRAKLRARLTGYRRLQLHPR